MGELLSLGVDKREEAVRGDASVAARQQSAQGFLRSIYFKGNAA
jgi:hypothetical protein